MEQRISIERMEQAVNIFGSFDENIRLLEKEFNVTVTNRDGELRISGEAEDVMHAAKAVQAMLTLSSRGEALGEQNVRYIIDMVRTGKEEQISELAGDVLCISAKGRPVKPKTLGQKEYIASVLKNTVTIGVGPAGTGKTYLAVAAAVQAFREKQVNRIILTRPAVEAGERLGFLPGDLQSKVDPYLRPLYDALFDMLGAETYQKYLERGNIEVTLQVPSGAASPCQLSVSPTLLEWTMPPMFTGSTDCHPACFCFRLTVTVTWVFPSRASVETCASAGCCTV